MAPFLRDFLDRTSSGIYLYCTPLTEICWTRTKLLVMQFSLCLSLLLSLSHSLSLSAKNMFYLADMWAVDWVVLVGDYQRMFPIVVLLTVSGWILCLYWCFLDGVCYMSVK